MQREIIARLNVKPSIDVQEEIRKRTDFLKKQVLGAGAGGLLIAISGGVDSAVTAALCKKATDELTAEQGKPYLTVGMFLPYEQQEDIADSYAVAEAIGFETKVETNIKNAVDAIALETERALETLGIRRGVTKEGKGNIKARTRMVVQYALANELNLLVIGTDHASEALTGFFTKWGDGAADAMPLSSLNKRQVRQLAKALGIPDKVIDKAPTAGLWEGQTDEGELGISYEDNCDYLEGKPVAPAVRDRLEAIWRKTEHKRSPIPGI